jgi:hypothetical protein
VALTLSFQQVECSPRVETRAQQVVNSEFVQLVPSEHITEPEKTRAGDGEACRRRKEKAMERCGRVQQEKKALEGGEGFNMGVETKSAFSISGIFASNGRDGGGVGVEVV